MNRKKKLGVIISLLTVCLAVQVVQQVHHSRWSAQWQHLFEKANQIQASVDSLESSGATQEEITAQRKALGAILSEINQSFRPDLIPKWLQACASLGTFSAVILLWRMRKSKQDTEQSLGGDIETAPERGLDAPQG